jgi:hypothetical protein
VWICKTSRVDSDAAFHANADPDPYPFIHDTKLFILYPVAVLQIRDVYPGSRILILIYPGSRIQQQQQTRRGKNKSYLFCSHKYHRTENYFIFEQVKKKL